MPASSRASSTGLVPQAAGLGLEPGQLPPHEMEPDRGEFVDDTVVATRGVGLLLQRSEAAPNLTQQIVEPQQVALGGLEATFGLLPTFAVLEDPGRLLDHRPPVLWTRVEHRVELTLADDDVLLASDAAVGEQLLDIEQATGRSVDRVLGVAAAEQRPGDGHLGELDR